MAFKKITRYISSSYKDSYLNKILDKISNGSLISKREEGFLEKYNSINEHDMKDFSHLSKNDVVQKIQLLISNKKKVMCELYDRDGKIDDEIVTMDHDFLSNKSILITKHGDKVNLFDKFFYSINYCFDNDTYYVYQGEEFFEKIESK